MLFIFMYELMVFFFAALIHGRILIVYSLDVTWRLGLTRHPKWPRLGLTRCPKWPRLGPTHLASKGTWERMLTWIGAKFGHLIHLLVLYLHVKFRGNPRSVLLLATILAFIFKHCLGFHASSDLDEI